MVAALLVLVGALLGLTGTLLGIVLSRRGDVELERWRKREETMRMLRWAAEMAARSSTLERAIGLETLGALMKSPLVDRADIRLVQHVAIAAASNAKG